MFKETKRVGYTNPNEITKSEFDELNKVHDFDVFTKDQYAMALASVKALIEKGETNELSQDEITSINEGVAELKALNKYVVNENIDGRIVKGDVWVQPKQVQWHDVIEKSETGEKIEKGTFLDTELNRNLNRVGVTFEKGKKVEKSEDKEESKEEVDEEMYKAAFAMVKKGDKEKVDVYKAMKEKYKDGDDKMVKAALNKAYKAMANDFMKKAEIEVEISGGDGDEEETKDKEDEKEAGTEKSKK